MHKSAFLYARLAQRARNWKNLVFYTKKDHFSPIFSLNIRIYFDTILS